MTDRVAKATQGLAEAFGIKDGWKFQIALQAANERVVNNVAQIRSNLELVSEGRMNTVGVAKSPDQLKLELKTFVGQLESGEIKKIDVKAISLASHKLTREEQPDKIIGSILD